MSARTTTACASASGIPGHKDAVAGYVLRDFAKADANWLDDLLRGVSDGAPALVAGDAGRFMNAVALRAAPPRSGSGTATPRRPEPAPDPSPTAPQGSAAPEAPPPPGDPKGPLARLAERFRR